MNNKKINFSFIEDDNFRNFFIEVCEILIKKDENLIFRDNGSAFGLSYPNNKFLTYITTINTFKFHNKSYILLSKDINFNKILDDVKKFDMALYNVDEFNSINLCEENIAIEEQETLESKKKLIINYLANPTSKYDELFLC